MPGVHLSRHEWGDPFDGENNCVVAYLWFDKLGADGFSDENAIVLLLDQGYWRKYDFAIRSSGLQGYRGEETE